MKSACESLKVFDFNEEDELSETTSARVVSKFKNPNAIDKYTFLEKFARGTNIQSEEIGNVPCVDVDAVESDPNCDGNAFSYTPLDPGVDCATKGTSGLGGVPQCSFTSHEQDPQFVLNTLQPGSLETRASSLEVASPEKSRLNCSESPSNDEPFDVIPDAGERMHDSSPSTSSDIVDDSASVDDPSSDHCLGDWDMGNSNKEIPVCPDYIEYDDKHCTECVLIFSSSCIRMKGSTDQGTFSFQRGLDDIVDIESLWFGRLEMAIVKIRTISKDGKQAEDVHGASGIEELKFAVVDSNWYEKQEVITSLDVRYSTLWNVVLDADIGRSDDTLVGQSACFSKRYFPNFDEPFEEVVYPKGDSDAVSISKRDVDLLQPDTFVNDTIIDFYIKHLKNKIQPEERRRFHFFNSFFFRKLADLDKDPSSACQGRAAFLRVRKWTRKVNIFEKDYVFIPVNFNYHWSLIVICHLGEVAKFQDEDVEKSIKVPCILHMDSIRGSHTGLKDLVQSYLWEEWKEKQKETSEDMSSKFSNLRFVSLELPQQQNSFDCGLFLLHYVELFLEEAPVYFSPFKITKFSNFLSVDWFPPTEASLKRVPIQRLIYELLENHSPENSPTINGGKHFPSSCPESFNRNETGVEFLSDRCIPKSHDANLLCSQGGQGIEINLLPTSSQRRSQCVRESVLVLRDLFEPEVTAGSFLDGQSQAFDRVSSFNEFKSAMSAMEVDVETGGHFGYASTADTGFNAITSEAFSYPPRDFGAETSLSDSDKTLVQEDLGVKEKLDQERSQSPENRDCSTESFASASETLSVPDSQDPTDHTLDSIGDADPLDSCQIALPGLTHRDSDMQEEQLIGDDSVSEADVPAPKRLRFVPNLEGDTKLTRSFSEDLHL